MNKFSAEDRLLARILSTLIWATASVYLIVMITSLLVQPQSAVDN
jgi:hypothetical protein